MTAELASDQRPGRPERLGYSGCDASTPKLVGRPVRTGAERREAGSLRRHLPRQLALTACAWLVAGPTLAAAQPVPRRHVVAATTAAGWRLAITADTVAPGLEAAQLEATPVEPTRGETATSSRTRRIRLDGHAWRVARRVSAIRVHAPSARALVLTDQHQDSSGLVVVDLREGRVVTSLTARHMTVSPDARYVAFEEYYSRLDTPWPWNETVYAVVDVTASAPDLERSCPFDDDRCRGRVLHLPSRQALCAETTTARGVTSCLAPGRPPQHERRSPFVWLDPQTLAYVSADLTRERFVVVEARFDPARALSSTHGSAGLEMRVAACDPARPPTDTGARCPPVRLAWSVDRIRRDGGDARLWIHFRHRLPEVPGGWLAVE